MKLITWFLDLLYPPKCVFCTRLLRSEETDICAQCRTDLPRVEHRLYRGECYECCYAAYYYKDAVAASVKKFKFSGRPYYAEAYGRILAMLILQERVEFDLISWVPISDRRAKQRGYRQSKLLAEAIANELGEQAVQTLRKIKDNPAQSSVRKPSERKLNVKNVYCAVSEENFSGKRILLVDDVITSGATLSECARTLKRAGAKSIVCVTLAAATND